MGVLYIISDRRSASTAFEIASKEVGDVSILLFGEASGLVVDKEQWTTHGYTGKIYHLGDIKNGVSPIEGVEVVDYSGWVKLIEENERVVSWT
jgi:hypothetical protein